jgi:hypothetical protein
MISFQIYVVRILREGHLEPSFVFRTFDEFQELHNKLSIIFPLWKLPGYVPILANIHTFLYRNNLFLYIGEKLVSI